MINYVFYTLLLFLFLSGCSSSNSTNEDIFQYKDSYIGDNSAVGTITRQLRNGEYLEGFELETKEEPYGMVLSYEKIEGNLKETVIYNATFIFALVKNAEWITFDFGDQVHKVSREELQNWYDTKLSEFTNEADLRKLAEEYLENASKVNGFF